MVSRRDFLKTAGVIALFPYGCVRRLSEHDGIVVNDIQEGIWRFGTEEPKRDDPSYYLRFCKTFDRTGSREMHYIKADNRDFLISLYYELRRLS